MSIIMNPYKKELVYAYEDLDLVIKELEKCMAKWW